MNRATRPNESAIVEVVVAVQLELHCSRVMFEELGRAFRDPVKSDLNLNKTRFLT